MQDIRQAEIVVRKDEKHLWDIFSGHHYMDHTLPRACTFFTFYALIEDNGTIQETLVGCLGVLMQIGKTPAKRITRFVILPEYQGLGYSTRILNGISEYYLQKNFVTYIVTFHPRLGDGLTRSTSWVESTNNQKEQNITTEKASAINNSSNNLRAGQKMYRFKYLPTNDNTRPHLDIHIDFLANDTSLEAMENNVLYQHRKKERIKELHQEKIKHKEDILDSQMVKGPLKKLRRKKRDPKKLKELKERKCQNTKNQLDF